MTLYRKHRPKTFEEMAGNEKIIKALTATMEKPDRPHVFLFTGPAGTGKTTAARICASMLGAPDENTNEVNTANNRGIDTAREIIEQIRTPPLVDGPMVFIIDECHKTTPDWQNAMLKPLEDTPEYVYFFLCTTDPQKLIKPILSRCDRYNFEALDDKVMKRLLYRIAKAEEKEVPMEVLEEVVDVAGGSPRLGITLLDRVFGVDDPAEAREVLGEPDEEDPDIRDLCKAMLSKSGNWKDTAEVLRKLKGQDAEGIRRAVIGYVSAILVNGRNDKRAAVILESFSEPVFNTGFPGLVLAAYTVLFGE
jgi:DNA polymerase III gamma/tau subunit